MNERIEELAKVARTWAENKFDKNQQAPGLYYHVDVVEKFAELIVRECARVIDRGDGEMSSMAETIWCNVCRDDILKHFGVEE